jgi:hypothetical protein
MCGSDPEVFVEDEKGNLVPAANILDTPIVANNGFEIYAVIVYTNKLNVRLIIRSI